MGRTIRILNKREDLLLQVSLDSRKLLFSYFIVTKEISYSLQCFDKCTLYIVLRFVCLLVCLFSLVILSFVIKSYHIFYFSRLKKKSMKVCSEDEYQFYARVVFFCLFICFPWQYLLIPFV